MNTFSRSFGTMQDLEHVTNALSLSPVLLTDSFVFAPFPLPLVSLLRSGTVLHRKSPEFLRIVQLFLRSFLPEAAIVFSFLFVDEERERLIASPARVRPPGRKEEVR